MYAEIVNTKTFAEIWTERNRVTATAPTTTKMSFVNSTL